MYLKSRFFRTVTLFITLIIMVAVGFAIYFNRYSLEYKLRHFFDKRARDKYVLINDGEKSTNSLDVEVRATNKSNKSNHISYRSCFDPIDGAKLCTSWSDYNDTPFYEYMGQPIKSDEAWKKTLRLYDELPDEQLQGRHSVEIRFYYKKDIISAGLGAGEELMDTQKAYIYYDSIAPTVSATSLNGWINSDNLSIKYNDKGTEEKKYVASGVKKISYKLCLYYEVVGSTVVCNEDPEEVVVKTNKRKKFKINVPLPSSYLTINVTDAAGNVTTYGDILKKDSNAPIINISKIVSEETGQTTSLTVGVEDSSSLVNNVTYTFSTSNIRPNEKYFTNDLPDFENASIELPTKSKKYYLWVRAEDYAGNVTYQNSGPVYVCDSLNSCSELATNKNSYLTLLYICIGVAIAALVSIAVITTKKKRK